MSAGTVFRRGAALVAALLFAALAAGCAHPISLNGNATSVVGMGKDKIDKKVGLAISDADRQREVTGPGGGGDKVRYFPYRDLETGLYIAMTEAFSEVVRVNGGADPKVKAESLNYVVTPVLVTNSYSPSIVTWPPTVFTIELTCKITDAEGKPVTEVKVQGDGRAEFDEFKANHSLSASRATDDLLKKLIAAIAAAAPKLR